MEFILQEAFALAQGNWRKEMHHACLGCSKKASLQMVSMVTPREIIFNAAISACEKGEKGGQWQQALSRWGEMRWESVARDVTSFRVVISAWEKCGQ